MSRCITQLDITCKLNLQYTVLVKKYINSFVEAPPEALLRISHFQVQCGVSELSGLRA